MANQELDKTLLEQWNENGYLIFPSLFTVDEVSNMSAWVEEIAKWPAKENEHLNYYEKLGDEVVISRTENFLPFHQKFKKPLDDSKIYPTMEALLGEPVLLFKEKINYKYKGTGKHYPHQDIHAFDTSPLAFQDYHYNCAVFIDDATIENGCFQVVPGYKKQLLDRNDDGFIVAEVADKLDWQPVVVKAGSAVIFDCWVPHKSERNMSNTSRRSIYLTFNGISKGDLREAHYRDRASGKAVTREINSDLFIEKKIPETLAL